MEILELGVEVETIVGGITGLLTAATINLNNSVRYEIVYFVGDEFKSIWLTDKEFRTKDNLKKQIGFK